MEALTDALGRVHNNLRISVTDRCNIRCFYCMPDENVVFQRREQILSFEEIVRFVRVVAACGVNKLRITGGEPLVRCDLAELVQQLRGIESIQDIALTTNGVLLAKHAAALKRAGLDRLNVSLDTLDDATFRKIARRDSLARVLKGLAKAREVGFARIRLNAIAIQGMTESEVVPLARFARAHDFELRFIEFMPLDAENSWQQDSVLRGERIRDILEQELGPLVPAKRDDPSQPAVDYVFQNGRGRVGFINPVSEPFCENCNRLRLTAEGQLRNCLFSSAGWDARALMRGGGGDDDLLQLVRDCLEAKKPGHGMDDAEFQRPERAMYQIGG